jgi:chromosome segregation ATPase
MEVLFLAIASLQLAVIFFVVFTKARGMNEANREISEHLEDEIRQKRELVVAIDEAREELVSEDEFHLLARKYQVALDILKEEQDKYVIAQAELESLDKRLRELDEVSRELEASSTESKEELKILKKKQGELKHKNDELKVQIQDSVKKIEELVAEIELTVQMKEQVARMKSDLVSTEERIDSTMTEIDSINEQYFRMKKKYDALDVEFAQLFQQLSEQ